MITVTKTKYINIIPPHQALEIDHIPVPPDPKTQKDVAIYVIDLWDWAQKCNNKLNFVKQYVDGAEQNMKKKFISNKNNLKKEEYK